jgi:hypothetical protein
MMKQERRRERVCVYVYMCVVFVEGDKQGGQQEKKSPLCGPSFFLFLSCSFFFLLHLQMIIQKMQESEKQEKGEQRREPKEKEDPIVCFFFVGSFFLFLLHLSIASLNHQTREVRNRE